MFNPSRLTLARQRRGMTKKLLADRVGVTDRMISFYEDGDKAPSDETLRNIAEVLRFPVEFFHDEHADEPSFETASFRAPRSLTSGERDTAYATGTLAILVSRWIESRFILPKPNVPSMRGFGEPEAAAQALRVEWRLGERPIQNMIHVLEANGVRVFSLPPDSRKVDAFSVWQRDVPFVFINTSKTGERIRFDAAHELGHLVLHQHGERIGRVAEMEADRFASAFLMPRASVLAHGPNNPTLGVLSKHKARWGVSAAALAHRLHDLKLSSAWNYRGLCIELAKQGWDNEPAPALPRETSQALSKVLAALRADGVQHSTIARELNIKTEEVSCMTFNLPIMPIDSGSIRREPQKSAAKLTLVTN
jgi:Zn-dependent peptidase ImmA (M78 family)/DNA-binding XRE family transcriptional regulator